MNQFHIFSADFQTNAQNMDSQLRVQESFDLVIREAKLGARRLRMYFVDGFVKDAILTNILTFLMQLSEEKTTAPQTTREFADVCLNYIETEVTGETAAFQKAIFSGMIGLLVEGFSEAILIDARVYPVRQVAEPENDKVLMGPHEGFVETLIFNTALIRRRIRDANLTISLHQIGERSKTDVALCYLNGKAPDKTVRALQEKLADIHINALTMGQESLTELLVPKQWYNPFPKVRYTERPDAAAASISEGSVIILVDNSPAAIIIPTGFFDFLQDTNDYFLSPFMGSYLRLMRLIIFFLTVFLAPAWYLLMKYPQVIPEWLEFVGVSEEIVLPIVFQFLIIEMVIDALKLASLNTPSALSNSFSVVGALVLGDFAVRAGWFNPEVVLYMAFIAIANFTQTNFELGYALKVSRILLVVLTGLFSLWGFLGGLLLLFLLLITTKTVTGRCYLYPIIPCNPKKLGTLLFRKPINRDNC